MRNTFLPLSRPFITGAELTAVKEVLESGHLTTGPKVTEFEKEFSKYIGSRNYAVALNSCTAGLYLSLLASGIGKGDEVIVPTWTFVATAHTVLWTGARPVLCDIEESSLNIDIRKLKGLFGSRTRCIMPVHFAGYPCKMDEIIAFARSHNLIIVEDAAHAAGTEYKGKKIGNFGDLTAFSFYATKNLACGEGGMVVSKNQGLIEKIRKLSYFGVNKRAFSRYEKPGEWYYEVEELGYKYNMDSIHAAIGLAQLQRLEQMNERRREIARLYKAGLDKRIRFTEDRADCYHAYHLFPILIDRKIMDRNELVKELKKRNIGTGVHFIPLHKHPYYKNTLASKSGFPVADKLFEEIISLPMFPQMSDKDVLYVIENINSILKRRS